jgi:transcriptional regulator with XRE-family HTH domain
MSPTAWTDILTFKGLTLTQAADISGIQRASLSGLAGGHTRASVPMAHTIANAIGCHTETLFPTMRAIYVEAEEIAA